MQTRDQHELAKALQHMYSGLERTHGIWTAKKGYEFIHTKVTLEHYIDHIAGRMSLGIIPITDNDLCKFGAIDDDSHKKDKTQPIVPWTKEKYKKLLDKIKFLKLPLTVTKSKNGGAHMTLHLDKFYKAKDVRHILKKMAYALGYPRDIEVFPKQDTLRNEDGSRSNGSFVNLPYHNGNTRVLLDFEGNELKAREGLMYAHQNATDESNWSKFKLLDHGKTQDRNERTFCATAFLKKHYDDWEDQVVNYNDLFNEPPLSHKEITSTVISSNKKKDYADKEIIETPPTELVGHDIQDYRKLDIPIPNFILERLFKERSINFLFGEKGKGKSMFALGLAYAMSHGLPFLNYKTPYCYPVILVDGEMDPYDLIERDKPFQETFGESPKDFFHVVNWYFQKDQNIPDIKEPIGQDLITNYCKKVEELTNKPPFLILDNLRSLSNYVENDSDSWRPIGKWLLKLRGLGYSTLVLDHTGHGSGHMRGTSSKSDWANVCLKIESEGQKGGSIMKVKLSFDKARGLKPDETGDFVAQYDFAGNWTLGQSTKELDQDETFHKITQILDEWQKFRLKLYPKPKAGASDEERDQWFKNCYPNGNKMPTQDYIAKKLECSVGKCNGLMKKFYVWYERESANGGQGKQSF